MAAGQQSSPRLLVLYCGICTTVVILELTIRMVRKWKESCKIAPSQDRTPKLKNRTLESNRHQSLKEGCDIYFSFPTPSIYIIQLYLSSRCSILEKGIFGSIPPLIIK